MPTSTSVPKNGSTQDLLVSMNALSYISSTLWWISSAWRATSTRSASNGSLPGDIAHPLSRELPKAPLLVQSGYLVRSTDQRLRRLHSRRSLPRDTVATPDG